MKGPEFYINGWRFLNIIFLVHLWFIGETSTNAFVLILFLLIMTTLRWRFQLPMWSVTFDFLICLIFLQYTDIAYFGLALPIFELAFKGRGYLSLLFLIIPFAVSVPSSLLFWYYFLACFFGVFSYIVLKNHEAVQKETDIQRKQTYDLEKVRAELLEANQSISHQAELMERYRISRDLHDHLGHDLTGTLFAFKAYEYIEDEEVAENLRAEIKKRLERSTENLRETVHNMTPLTFIGVEQVDSIVEGFQQYDVHYYKSGDMQKVSAHHWNLLVSYLKEALTNISRHSDAKKVEVNLQVTGTIVRLAVHDDGTPGEQDVKGSGLRNLQMRAKSMGGSLSINHDDGYLLVCVLPIDRGGEEGETVNRR